MVRGYPGHPPQQDPGGLPDAGLDEVDVPDAEVRPDPPDLLQPGLPAAAGRRRRLRPGGKMGLDGIDELVGQVLVHQLTVKDGAVEVLRSDDTYSSLL